MSLSDLLEDTSRKDAIGNPVLSEAVGPLLTASQLKAARDYVVSECEIGPATVTVLLDHIDALTDLLREVEQGTDVMMAALDRIDTDHEGSPKAHDLRGSANAREAMLVGNVILAKLRAVSGLVSAECIYPPVYLTSTAKLAEREQEAVISETEKLQHLQNPQPDSEPPQP